LDCFASLAMTVAKLVLSRMRGKERGAGDQSGRQGAEKDRDEKRQRLPQLFAHYA